MKVVRSVHQITRFESLNAFRSTFYSTKPIPSGKVNSSPDGPTMELYRRISPVGHSKASIVPILDRWVEEGRSVDPQGLRYIIKQLRFYKRFNHALQVSLWMVDKRNYCSSSDASITLDLISKSQGIEQAEKYFSNIPEDLDGIGSVYGALLNCYATSKCVEKAEALMNKMRDLGFLKNALSYNTMLTLYSKTGKMDKFNALLKEMEKKGIAYDNYTRGIRLNAYGDVMDIEGINKIVAMMESDSKVLPVWSNYTVAATGYTKAGLLDKAFEMLQKAETCITNKHIDAYNTLLIKYADTGRKDDVLRVWSHYKSEYKVYNKGYASILKSLVKLDDLESADRVFEEWESEDVTYDIFIPNIIIRAYCNKGLFEKADALIKRAMEKGGQPDAWTWFCFVEGYLQYDQPQKAVVMLKKVIENAGTQWKPDTVRLKAFLERLKLVEAQLAKGFVKLLLQMGIISSNQVEELCIS